MKSKSIVLLCIIVLSFSCSKDKVEQTSNTGISNEIEQIKNEEVSPVDLAKIPDGEYIGEVPFRERFLYKVKVTMKSGKIENIEVLQNGTENEYAVKALEVVPRMLEAQSPNVDVVTGATGTSKALMECVEKALASAQ